ncbi:hypothetical protein, partial [Prevotella multiformis]|uniref:hypothetical protein n=1 Tax=Prevotella multiformis TaxID=282402 RepID=UPI0023F0458A
DAPKRTVQKRTNSNFLILVKYCCLRLVHPCMMPYLKRAGRKSQAGADGSGFLLTDTVPHAPKPEYVHIGLANIGK